MTRKDKLPAFWVSPIFGEEGDQLASGIGCDGKEYPSDVPAEIPIVDYDPGQQMLEMIQRVMRSEQLRQQADAEGFDTPEEADDFEDWEDEYELTPYQKYMMEKDLNPDPTLARRPSQGGQEPAAPGGSSAPPTNDASKSSASSGPEGTLKEVVSKPDSGLSSG